MFGSVAAKVAGAGRTAPAVFGVALVRALLAAGVAWAANVQCVVGEPCEGTGSAGVKGEAERTATLLGAAETLRKATGFHTSPEEGARREPYLASARSRLDEAVWEKAVAEGRSMTFEKTVEYALSEKDPATPLSLASGQPSSGAQPPGLTRRERDVAALATRGLTNRQIASELSISEHTAATHVARIRKKLNLRSRAQIGSWLAERPPPPSDHPRRD